jgi:hypothetical protein
MFTKIKTFFHDLYVKIKGDVTNAIAVISTFFGTIMAHIDDIVSALDPNFGQTLSTALGDVKWAGRWMLTIGLATMLAKLKSLIQSPPKA